MNPRAQRILCNGPTACDACGVEGYSTTEPMYLFWTPYKKGTTRTFHASCVDVSELALAVSLYESDQAAERERVARGYGSGSYQGD